jgi:hypothetical protein
VITAGSIDSGSAPFRITRSARDPEESQLVSEEQTKKPIRANPISLPGFFTRQGVGRGDSTALLAEGDGEIVGCGVAVGVACGVAVGLLATEADALGEAEATGLEEATADGVALGNGFAFLASLSRTPARRSRLCFAVKKVSSKVTPKKIAPR